MSLKLFTWHDAVHEAREGARIHYWRFAFTPDYDSEAIFRTIRAVLEREKIQSYILYETFGDYDVLLRLWAPRRLHPEDLSLTFEEALTPLSLHQHDYLAVQNTYLHWVWQTSTDDTPNFTQPTVDALTRVTNDKIVELNQYNDEVMRIVQRHDEDVDAQPQMPIPSWVSEYEDFNLLRAVPVKKQGVKFCILFDHPRRTLRRPERELIARQISAKCASIARSERERLKLSDDVQMSFYVGTGPMTDFFIVVRAPDGHFYSFARRLIFGLLDLGLHRTYSMRTYTEVFSDRDYAGYKDSPITEESFTNIGELLRLPESESLEFKATFHADLRTYLLTGQVESPRFVADNIVKAVCGLLNAPFGGNLVIGVLEVDRELDKIPPAERTIALERLRGLSVFLPDEADTVPAPGDTKALIGIELDGNDWDEFLRRLQDTLRTSITPSPIPFIEVQRTTVRGKTLALVHARPATTWFYAKGSKDTFEFYVRELASTRAYSGPEADLYRSVNPRVDSLS